MIKKKFSQNQEGNDMRESRGSVTSDYFAGINPESMRQSQAFSEKEQPRNGRESITHGAMLSRNQDAMEKSSQSRKVKFGLPLENENPDPNNESKLYDPKPILKLKSGAENNQNNDVEKEEDQPFGLGTGKKKPNPPTIPPPSYLQSAPKDKAKVTVTNDISDIRIFKEIANQLRGSSEVQPPKPALTDGPDLPSGIFQKKPVPEIATASPEVKGVEPNKELLSENSKLKARLVAMMAENGM